FCPFLAIQISPSSSLNPHDTMRTFLSVYLKGIIPGCPKRAAFLIPIIRNKLEMNALSFDCEIDFHSHGETEK
ncbi:hypothetical protein, partial [Paenibacillus sp. BJ-4]|uniref:hypothetical protein n=1 Tax=Paenibacillus sp. BJ-4 TaxID=2878097 RepID=UPI001CF0821D